MNISVIYVFFLFRYRFVYAFTAKLLMASTVPVL